MAFVPAGLTALWAAAVIAVPTATVAVSGCVVACAATVAVDVRERVRRDR